MKSMVLYMCRAVRGDVVRRDAKGLQLNHRPTT